MKKINYPTPEYEKKNTDVKCPQCGGEMRHGTIGCPDNMPGCLVLHYGYICLKGCGVFQ
jgi:hypothetical protein